VTRRGPKLKPEHLLKWPRKKRQWRGPAASRRTLLADLRPWTQLTVGKAARQWPPPTARNPLLAREHCACDDVQSAEWQAWTRLPPRTRLAVGSLVRIVGLPRWCRASADGGIVVDCKPRICATLIRALWIVGREPFAWEAASGALGPADAAMYADASAPDPKRLRVNKVAVRELLRQVAESNRSSNQEAKA
jgi:hypothetical protein